MERLRHVLLGLVLLALLISFHPSLIFPSERQPFPAIPPPTLIPTPSLSTPPSFSRSTRPTVAVCFFGLTRSLRNHTLDSIEKYLLGRLHEQGFDTHVFLHTYALDVLFNPWGGEHHVKLDKEEWRLLHPLAFEVEDLAQVDASIDYSAYLKYGNPWHSFNPSNITVYNHVRQLRSLHRCWNLVERHMNETRTAYRYVIMARPDVRYTAPGLPDLDFFCLSEECRIRSGMRQRRIAIAYEDRFAVGIPEVVKLWATRYDLSLFFVSHYERGLLSEAFSRWSLLWHDLEYLVLPFCFERVRANGDVRSDDLDMCHYGPVWTHRPPPVRRVLPGSSEVFYAADTSPPPPLPPGENINPRRFRHALTVAQKHRPARRMSSRA